MATVTANITAITNLGTTPATVKYTAVNNFTVGQNVIVTSASTSAFNIASPGIRIVDATANDFTVLSSATGTSCTALATATVPTSADISDAFVYDLSTTELVSSTYPTDIAYDISIGDNSFLIYNTSQAPHIRETAQYKKDQFDSSTSPGEQSLLGWWLRSQTSWHYGAGIRYFEPGVEKNVDYKFYDSRGVDIWTIGEASILKDTFIGYSGSTNNLVGTPATYTSGLYTYNCLVTGSNDGSLKRLRLNNNTEVTGVSPYEFSYTIASHTSDPFYSITTDGTYYYAICDKAVHKGLVDGTGSDVITNIHNATGTSKATIKYVKGKVLASSDNVLYNINANHTSASHSAAKDISDTASGTPASYSYLTHLNTQWYWNDITDGSVSVYASGYANGVSEVWAISYDKTLVNLDMAGGQMVTRLPFGETINAIKYYLGYLVLATSKGVRICQIDINGNVTLGPLTYQSAYGVNGITEKDTYVYCSTSLDSTVTQTNAALIRINLGQPFDDGTFAYANDLEYVDTFASNATDVFLVDDRLLMLYNTSTYGKIAFEHTTQRRASGYLETGYIRYGVTEPKYFKYINVGAEFTAEDSIGLQTIDNLGNEYDILSINSATQSQDLEMHYPTGSQEILAFRFIFANNSPLTNTPTLKSYRVKSIPAMKRQRMIQYPLSCFDIEQDRYNSQFGYVGRSYDLLHSIEELEEVGNFVIVNDWRTNESYTGLIETMRFENSASTDKISSGYGGILTVTIRKVK